MYAAPAGLPAQLETTDMAEKRVIKKYPNRRLYDTAVSKYITLDDVRRLVLEGGEFAVTDAKTGEDITRGILLQIIIEQEVDGEPVFTIDALTQIIRFYGDAVQGLAANFLERSLSMFTEQQKRYQEQINDAVVANPITAITEMTQRNLKLWQGMQEEFFKAAGRQMGNSREAAPKEPGAKATNDNKE